MRNPTFAIMAALVFCGVNPAWALGQTVIGRITFMDTRAHELMLDNAYQFEVTPTVNLAALAIAEKVSLTFEKRQSKELAIKVTRIS